MTCIEFESVFGCVVWKGDDCKVGLLGSTKLWHLYKGSIPINPICLCCSDGACRNGCSCTAELRLRLNLEVRNNLQSSYHPIYYSSMARSACWHTEKPLTHYWTGLLQSTPPLPEEAKILTVNFCFVINGIDRSAVYATWQITGLILCDGWLTFSLCCCPTRLEIWLDSSTDGEKKSSPLVWYDRHPWRATNLWC